MLTTTKPAIAAFVGVAGGVKDVRIGDVVVASKVYGYESGKDQASGFAPRGSGQAPDFKLEQSARLVRQRTAWQDRIDLSTWADVRPTMYVEPIAAGEKVVASTRSATARYLRESFSDVFAVEMEGRGFLEAVRVAGSTRGVIVRGISDLLSKKAQADADDWQPRAADAAAAALCEMLTVAAKSIVATPTASPTDPEIAEGDHRLLNGRLDVLQTMLARVRVSAPRAYQTLRDSVDLAQAALARADEGTIRADLARQALKTRSPRSVAEGAPDPVIVREGGFGTARWKTGDEYWGDMAGPHDWGVGVYKIYTTSEMFSDEGVSYFRGDVRPKNLLGPLGVYEFAHGSMCAGSWEAQRPRRGYMTFVNRKDPFDFYFGEFRQVETEAGNLWKPGGLGVGIALETMTATCGLFEKGLVTDPHAKTFTLD